MPTKLELNALNANFSNGAISLANSTATVTCGTSIVNATVNGVFITSALSASAAALAPVLPSDGTTVATWANLAALQGCVIVHCVNAAGARKELLGPVVTIDSSGNPTTGRKVFEFPIVPDNLTPIAYSTVKNVTNAFIFGTTNWNATGVTAATTQVSTLPRRPLTS